MSSLPWALSARRKILLKVANRAEVDQVVVFPGNFQYTVLPRGPYLHEGGPKIPVR